MAEFRSWLDQAEATNTWLVLVYHRIVPAGQGAGGQYDTNQAAFASQLDALQNSGLAAKPTTPRSMS